MKLGFVIILLISAGNTAVVLAASPQFPDTSVAYEIISIPGDPRVEQEFYGTLSGNPHMYEFTVTEPTTLDFTVGQNAADTAMLSLGYIVVELLESGKVTERARSQVGSLNRRLVENHVLGLTFTELAPFSETLPPGTYRIEVSTLSNLGQYRFVIGDTPVINGYLGTWKRVWLVNGFFNQRALGLLQSIFVQMHLIGAVLVIVGWRFIYPWWKKRTRHGNVT